MCCCDTLASDLTISNIVLYMYVCMYVCMYVWIYLLVYLTIYLHTCACAHTHTNFDPSHL